MLGERTLADGPSRMGERGEGGERRGGGEGENMCRRDVFIGSAPLERGLDRVWREGEERVREGIEANRRNEGNGY